MPLRAYGQLFIQATMPAEDPVKVGSVWSDTSTGLVKVCTSVAPYTFVTVHGGSVAWSDITDFTGSSLAQLVTRSATDLSSGTLPDARFPATLPAISGVNLTDIPATSIASPAALSKSDDTNVTLTLGGTPTTALLRAASLTLGWTGTLSPARGGTGIASYAVGDLLYANGSASLTKLTAVAVGSLLGSAGTGTAPAWQTAGVLSTSLRTPLLVGGTTTTSPLNLQATTATGIAGADVIFLGGNNGATELGRLTFEGRLGLGTLSAPTATIFEAHGDGTISPVLQSTISVASAASSAFRFRKSRGSKASPTKTLSADDIGAIVNAGYEEVTPGYTGTRASLVFSALEDFTAAANGTSAKLRVTPIGSATIATQLTVTAAALTFGSMVTPAATGKRYLVIDTNGVVTSQTTAPVGT